MDVVVAGAEFEAELGNARLRSLLDHFAEVRDPRELAKVRYPLSEVLLLVVAASICSCDDYDEIVEWGETHLSFLRRLSEFHFGIPGADWLRVVMIRLRWPPFPGQLDKLIPTG